MHFGREWLLLQLSLISPLMWADVRCRNFRPEVGACCMPVKCTNQLSVMSTTLCYGSIAGIECVVAHLIKCTCRSFEYCSFVLFYEDMWGWDILKENERHNAWGFVLSEGVLEMWKASASESIDRQSWQRRMQKMSLSHTERGWCWPTDSDQTLW